MERQIVEQPAKRAQLRVRMHIDQSGQEDSITPPSDSVATMSLIDDVYRAAGLPLR